MQVLAERAAWDWLKREAGSTEMSVVLPVSAGADRLYPRHLISPQHAALWMSVRSACTDCSSRPISSAPCNTGCHIWPKVPVNPHCRLGRRWRRAGLVHRRYVCCEAYVTPCSSLCCFDRVADANVQAISETRAADGHLRAGAGPRLLHLHHAYPAAARPGHATGPSARLRVRAQRRDSRIVRHATGPCP